MKNVLVWGDGFVGSHLKYNKIKERASIDPSHIRATLMAYKPDVVINCIGFCGSPNIDQCETMKEKTFITNAIIPSIIASECDKLGIHMIHIGSGCIYSGSSPNLHCTHCKEKHEVHQSLDYSCKFVDLGFNEKDPANPVSYYSNTKYACDLMIGSLPNVAITRIRMPVSSRATPRNFISKIRNYKQVIDIPNSMTIVDDLVRSIDWMIENKKTGVYNVVNPEPITAAQVMREYQKYVPEHKFDVITGGQLDKITAAKRSNCILDGSKLKNEGFIMTPSIEALKKCVKDYVEDMKGK